MNKENSALLNAVDCNKDDPFQKWNMKNNIFRKKKITA